MYASNEKDRRGNYLIDPRTPRRALLTLGFHLLTVGVCVGVPLVAMMRSMDTLMAGQSASVVALFERWQAYLFLALGVYVLVATTAWLVAGLWRDHRTAGPIIRLTRFAHELVAGDFSARIGLRERDELQALANALNQLAEGLEQRDEALLQEISDRVENLGRSQREPQSDDAPSETPQDVVALVDSAFETAPTSPVASFPHPN